MEPHDWKIGWSDRLSVGIPEIDADHERFIFLINELHRSIRGRMDVDKIKKRLLLIVDDAVYHFGQEERLFKEWKYPDVDDHANKHAEIIEMIQTAIRTADTRTPRPEWILIGLAIKEALITHILTDDMKYAEFYRRNIATNEAQRSAAKAMPTTIG
jgi:hemerythrin